MRALWSRLFHPLAEAVAAGQLRAVRAHHRAGDCPEADEAAEEVLELLRLLRGATVGTLDRSSRGPDSEASRVDGSDAAPTIIGASRC